MLDRPVIQSNDNNKRAQLAYAYQELGNELGSGSLKVVGGYTLGRVIGEGTYGCVYLATHRLTGHRCAIKMIPKAVTASLTREIHHHRRFHHPSIVQLYEILATESHVWLVSELCSGGELFDYLVERGRFPEAEARRLFGELVVAVGYLHRHGVVHRDLKLENVLLDGDLRVKLGDLGFAREWQRGQLLETFCGTTGYASPEMLMGRKYNGVETDIWSLGVILYTILCGGMPFDDDDEQVMKGLIIKGEYETPEWLSPEAQSLLSSLLKIDPSQRLSIEAILSHTWFTVPLEFPMNHSKETLAPLSTASPIPMARVSTTNSAVSSDVGASGSDGPKTSTQAGPSRHSGENLAEPEPQSSLTADKLLQGSPRFLDDSLRLQPSQNSRTPSRTKRRSVSSSLSLERRHSHHSASGEWSQYPTENYSKQLHQEPPASLSTPSEKRLLHRLHKIGIDTEQLSHSVTSNACDTSSATWWIMRAKQRQKGELDDVVEEEPAQVRDPPRESVQEQPSEPAQAARAVSPVQSSNTPKSSPQDVIAPATPKHFAPVTSAFVESLDGQTPRNSPMTLVTPTSGGMDDARMRTRSPSMNMLQRATSALTGTGWRNEERKEVLPVDRGSPTKLIKLPPSQRTTPETPMRPPLVTPAPKIVSPAPAPESRPKVSKRDTLWNSFRYMFNEDKRRRKGPADIAIGPTMVLARSARPTHHIHRTPQPSALAKRGSIDGRPIYSRRSSGVNSRRSSVNSVPHPLELPDHHLSRRMSRRSQGSQTPTSEKESLEFPRPGSAQSHHQMHSMRSPSMHSESSGRFRSVVPASPLHNYHRRPPAGSSSSRVRHFKVIPEATVVRSSSIASSVRSATSSRASSVDMSHRDYGSDFRDDSSFDDEPGSSRRLPLRKPSPLSREAHRTRRKRPLRDIFKIKEDDWIDEDDERHSRLAGGLGQRSSGAAHRAPRVSRGPNRRQAGKPAVLVEDRVVHTSKGRDTDFHAAGLSGRRVTLPSGRTRQPPVIEEDEEDL